MVKYFTIFVTALIVALFVLQLVNIVPVFATHEIVLSLPPWALALLSFSAGLIVATIPPVQDLLVRLFSNVFETKPNDKTDIPDSAVGDGSPSSSAQNTSPASPARSVPLRAREEVLREKPKATQTSARHQKPQGHKPQGQQAPIELTNNQAAVPVEGLGSGVLNVLGGGVVYVVDTVSDGTRPIHHAVKSGCSGAYRGARSVFDTIFWH
ncbi:hypothetical protein V5T82_17765 [Magnetovibrio sp. PR-2]|uniref:hypothetical protein n=1 Tax=Magnetovibrio sp. PR-2 TaxID=3120356 RepID=UPI002FCDF4C2